MDGNRSFATNALVCVCVYCTDVPSLPPSLPSSSQSFVRVSLSCVIALVPFLGLFLVVDWYFVVLPFSVLSL